MKLHEAIKGRRVVYTPFEGCQEHQKEYGVIKMITPKYIFVIYGNDHFAKATLPEDLEYTSGHVERGMQ